MVQRISHPEQELFRREPTEALITTLVKIGELRVLSRSSAMQYKVIRKPLRDILKARQMQAIGSNRASKVRSNTAALHSSSMPPRRFSSGPRVTSGTCDVLALQAEVAQAIAREGSK